MKKFLGVIIVLVLILIGIMLYFRPSEEEIIEDKIEVKEQEEDATKAGDSALDAFENDPMFDDLDFDEEVEEDSVMSV